MAVWIMDLEDIDIVIRALVSLKKDLDASDPLNLKISIMLSNLKKKVKEDVNTKNRL